MVQRVERIRRLDQKNDVYSYELVHSLQNYQRPRIAIDSFINLSTTQHLRRARSLVVKQFRIMFVVAEPTRSRCRP